MNRLVYLFAASLLLSVALTSASATTYWISTTGSDSFPGTSVDSPWATWAHADSVVVSGDTVRVLPGTYNFSGYTTGDCIITKTPGVTWISDTPLQAKLVCPSSSRYAGTWRIQGHDSTVEGFDCSTTSTLSYCIYVWTGGDNAKILRNYVHDVHIISDCSYSGDGISIQDSSVQGVLIDSNLVYNVGPAACPNQFGITADGQNQTISNNIMVGNGSGFEWHSGSNGSSGSVVVNNTFVSNRRLGALIDTTAPYTAIILQNNIFVNNGNSNGLCGVDNYNNGSISFTTNLFYGNLPGAYCIDGVQEPAPNPSGQTYADPKFVNNTGDNCGNYHVQALSPAINAGTSGNAPAGDFDGTSRPQGSGDDLGAYEYTSNLIALAQSSNVLGSSLTSISQSFPCSNTAGNLIIAFVRMSTTTQTVQITDSLGNAYTDAVSQGQSTDGHQIHIFYAKNIAGGANTVTATFSATNNHPWLAIYEYSGLSTTAPLDQTAAAQGDTAAPNTGLTSTTTSAHELLFAGLGLPAASYETVSSGSGFTLLQGDAYPNTSPADNESQITTAAGQYVGTFNMNYADYWTAVVATFK